MTRTRGACRHILGYLDNEWIACGEPGTSVRLKTPAGRPPAEAGPYCDRHGGARRAQEEAEGDWNYLAPPELSLAEVQEAGCMALTTDCHVLVIRRESSGHYVAQLGVGSCTISVARQDPRPGRSRSTALRSRHRSGRGNSWSTWREAVAAGWTALLARRAARVEEIRQARGGTLDWGTPLQVDVEPIVVHCSPGECAWDALVNHPRYAAHPLSGLPILAGAP